jgi:diaminohydroxyphosphoribosylaminopyrimidine deaminase/5-amino-6-(5-phosphoribosylamino)uracil reductase
VTDADYMARALFMAGRGRGRTSPNPVVGAVVVSPGGVVVGHGYHARAGGPHAEVNALDMAGACARGATLYCTLEPCIHTGRTGPCVPRIAEAGIARVVAAVEDPNPLVCGQGFASLSARGVQVDIGLGAAAAIALNQPFFTTVREHRPFVILKAAVSSDRYLSEAPGRRTQLTGAPANRHAHAVRAEVDAIAVGVGTVLVDDPQLTARGVYRERPFTRVIFDRSLRTPPQAQLLSTLEAGPVIIVTSESTACAESRNRLEAAGAQILVTDGTVRSALNALGQRGITSVLLEGGAALHAAAWDEGVVDFAGIYVTPHVLGPSGVPFLPGRRFVSALNPEHRVIRPLGADVLIEGYVHGPR